MWLIPWYIDSILISHNFHFCFMIWRANRLKGSQGNWTLWQIKASFWKYKRRPFPIGPWWGFLFAIACCCSELLVLSFPNWHLIGILGWPKSLSASQRKMGSHGMFFSIFLWKIHATENLVDCPTRWSLLYWYLVFFFDHLFRYPNDREI